MTAFLAAFDLYYFCYCAVAGGIASGVTVAKGARMRAIRIGAVIGAILYIVQLPVWVAAFSDAPYSG